MYKRQTEGSDYVDSRLRENIMAVSESPLRAGFYHFFSYDSPEETLSLIHIYASTSA